MSGTRLSNWPTTTTTTAADDYLGLDGPTENSRRILADSLKTDFAADYVAGPTTYKLTPLNGSNKIDAAYLPASGDTPKGDWLANNTAPVLSDGTGTAGDYYDVTDSNSGTIADGAGTLAIDGDSVAVGDRIKYDGANWYIVPQVANVLDGDATAAAARTTLDVLSAGEVNERTNASDASSTTLQKYTANGSNKWDLRGDGRRLGTHVRQPYAGGAYFQELNTSSIADAAIVTVSSLLFGSDRGYLQVVQASGAAQGWAQLVIESSAADPAILHDRHSKWSTTKDTASKINIYRDGADSNTLKIQNNTGASILLSITMHGHYLA